MVHASKTVLVAQQLSEQANLWKDVLESQSCQVIFNPPQPDLLNVAAAYNLDLMIVDMTTGLFNPYALCRESRTRFPQVPIVLTHQVQRQIEPAEQRWAIYQGAAEVVPGLSDAADILEALGRVFRAIGWPAVDSEKLYAKLEKIGLWPRPQDWVKEIPPPVKADPPPPPKSNPVLVSDQAKYQVLYRGRPVKS
ncbi:MAG: response regulator [Cyanobacteriota bacterium]|nr:response regulator [Cyanobacteriota bacterium]